MLSSCIGTKGQTCMVRCFTAIIELFGMSGMDNVFGEVTELSENQGHLVKTDDCTAHMNVPDQQ